MILSVELRLIDHLGEIVVKKIASISECEGLCSESRWRFCDSGCFAFNGRISNLYGKCYTCPKKLWDYSFSDIYEKYLDEEALTPTIMWELYRQWPWPSDHLIAASSIDLGDQKVYIASMNLLKKGFDDNRLQTSQGLGGHLSGRHLIEVSPRRYELDRQNSKDWDLASIRSYAQLSFIERLMSRKKIDLFGLQEVSAFQVVSLNRLATKYGYEVFRTNSGKVSKNIVSGEVDPKLQDVGIILVNLDRFKTNGKNVSHYKDRKGDMNKHITTVFLECQLTKKALAFTNTHADFGRVEDLAEHVRSSELNASQDFDWIIIVDPVFRTI